MKQLPLVPPRTNVLFIGNNTGRLKDIAFELQRGWCGVLWKERGLDGICTALLESPDLIICSTELPDVSGFELCRIVRSDFDLCQIPFFLIGESEMPGNKIDALDAGADEFFVIPHDSQQLLRKVFLRLEYGYVPSASPADHERLELNQTTLSTVMIGNCIYQESDRQEDHFRLWSGPLHFGIDALAKLSIG